MLTRMGIIEIILFCVAMGPSQAVSNITTCEEFEVGARFNPYDVVDYMWKIFYYWAEHTEVNPVVFSLPAKNRLSKFKETIEAIDPHLDVQWTRATLFMNPKAGTEVLFLYAGTPGAFRALVKVEQRNSKVRPYPIPLIKFADVRMKLVGKYMGMMCCEDLTAYALATMDNVPTTEYGSILAASTLGYHGENGRSYLYLKRKFEDEL